MPDGYQVWSEQLREVISDKLGWFYLLLVTSIVLLCGFFLVSPVGQIKLGNPIRCLNTLLSLDCHDIFCWNGNRPCLLRCRRALIPLCHFNGTSYPRVAGSLSRCFPLHFHWGIHAWAIYALIALALAYFGFRKEKYLLSVTLKPLFGKNKRYPW